MNTTATRNCRSCDAESTARFCDRCVRAEERRFDQTGSRSRNR